MIKIGSVCGFQISLLSMNRQNSSGLQIVYICGVQLHETGSRGMQARMKVFGFNSNIDFNFLFFFSLSETQSIFKYPVFRIRIIFPL